MEYLYKVFELMYQHWILTIVFLFILATKNTINIK